MILRTVTHCLSPAGPGARLSILIFHRVLPAPDPLQPSEPDPARFEQVLRWVTRWFVVLPLDEAVARLRAGSLPARAAAITFDDGYADNATLALPVLRRAGMPATFFIATRFLDGGRMWNDTVIEAVRAADDGVLDLADAGFGRFELGDAASRRQAIATLLPQIKYLEPARRLLAVDHVARAAGKPLPGDLMMGSDQVRELRRAGMQIGAHTRTHPILARLGDDEALTEIAGGKQDLEALLGEPVTLFAYPNGKPGQDYQARHAAMARDAGFAAAVSTAPGSATAASDPWQLPRFLPWDRQALKFGLRMVTHLRGTAAIA